ncbi:MAG: hypothetical protein CMG97_03070, partial [Marinovum sp.]|nr:hypothetical protein [Marinovum sp.]
WLLRRSLSRRRTLIAWLDLILQIKHHISKGTERHRKQAKRLFDKKWFRKAATEIKQEKSGHRTSAVKRTIKLDEKR